MEPDYDGDVTPTRWLDEHEQVVWRAFLHASNLLSEQLDRELQREAGIPHAYYEILVVLSESPGRVRRMSELAELCLSSRSRLSHAVARLEEAGCVERRSCPSDRRGAFAALTAVASGAVAKGDAEKAADGYARRRRRQGERVASLCAARGLFAAPPGDDSNGPTGADDAR